MIPRNMIAHLGQDAGATEVARGEPAVSVPQYGTTRRFMRTHWPVMATAFLALVVRLVYLLETRNVPFVLHPVGDAAGYYEWAREIARGNWIGTEYFYQAPGYPYTLALLFVVFGAGINTIRMAQLLWGVGSVVCLHVAAQRLFDRGAGAIAGMMLALYPPALFFDGIVQKASLGCLLLCVFLLLMTQLERARTGTGRLWTTLGMGLAAGLLALTRENALLWIVILVVWLAWCGRRARSHYVVSMPVVFLIGACMFLVPVGVRNKAVCGEWSVTTFQAGSNFYIGNNKDANGRYRPIVPGHETPEFERRDAKAVAERMAGRPLTAREVSRFWFGRAWSDIRGNPERWLELMGLKLLMVINAYEVADLESLYVYEQFSAILRWLATVWHFGVLLPVAGVGMVYTASRANRLWIYYILILSMVFSVAAFFILARYRYPLVPLLIPFAAAGCMAVYRTIRSFDWRGLLPALIIAVLASILSNMRVHPEKELDAMSFMNLATVMAADDLEGAISFFHMAVERNPSSAEARFNLAQALRLKGDKEGAIESYRAALAFEPGLANADFYLATVLEEIGDLEGAQAHYEQAIEKNPADEEARERLMMLEVEK
jgi:4-amino-4-deoxy-L-arabinose transferase-like glycosyltransferase